MGFVHVTQPNAAVKLIDHLVSLGYKASSNGPPIKYATGHVCPPCWRPKEHTRQEDAAAASSGPLSASTDADGWTTQRRKQKAPTTKAPTTLSSKAAAKQPIKEEEEELVLEENHDDSVDDDKDDLVLEQQPEEDDDGPVLEEQPKSEEEPKPEEQPKPKETRRRVQWSEAVEEQVSTFSWNLPTSADRVSVLPMGTKESDFPCLSPGTPKTIISDDLARGIAASRLSLATDESARNAKEIGQLADAIHLSSFEASASEYVMDEEQAAWNNRNDDEYDYEEEDDDDEDYVFEMMRQRLQQLKR